MQQKLLHKSLLSTRLCGVWLITLVPKKVCGCAQVCKSAGLGAAVGQFL